MEQSGHSEVGADVARNLEEVRAKMAAAALKAGRDESQIRLIAVSKTKPLTMIEAAMHAGQQSFGENYVQEAVAKVEAIPSADWHFIGSLQSNKVKQVIGKFSLIHSVDRVRLADELSKAAVKAAVVQDILVQVHIGDEATKHGAGLKEAPSLIEHVANLPGLRVRGIMSLPPLTEDERQARAWFASLREGFERWRKGCLTPEQSSLFKELSMGTSSDYEWAILEGATLVRVGTSIFGSRSRVS